MGNGDEDRKRKQIQQIYQEEQQKAIYNQVITKLTSICFDTCVASPGGKISSYESSCIDNCIGRYTDATQVVMQRMVQHGDRDHL